MELNKFIDALGTPEEWSDVTPEEYPDTTPETVSVEVTPVINPKKIIGSVATKGEVDQALNSLK